MGTRYAERNMTVSVQDWLEKLAQELAGEALTPHECEALRALAGVAAHASERTAAPISYRLVARAGLSPALGLDIVNRLACTHVGESP